MKLIVLKAFVWKGVGNGVWKQWKPKRWFLTTNLEENHFQKNQQETAYYNWTKLKHFGARKSIVA